MSPDSLALQTQEILRFQQSIDALHNMVQASRPVFESLRDVLALQWGLGNVAMILMLVVGLKTYFFAKKAIRAFNKDYILPRRWLVIYIATCAIMMVLFNALPSAIKIPMEYEGAINKLSIGK